MMSRWGQVLLQDHKLAYQTIVQDGAIKDLTEVITKARHTVVDEVPELEIIMLIQKEKIHTFVPRPQMPGKKRS